MVPRVGWHNWFEWPIPQPPRAILDDICNQLLQEFEIEYCWLDVLCLRQKGKSEHEAIRKDEWQIDVPTIGNVYRNAKSVFRYFNGLGLLVETDIRAWENPKHWKNRAWTLQEIRPDDEMIDVQPRWAPFQGLVPLNTPITGATPQKTIRQMLQPISELSLAVHSEQGCSIIHLAGQMSQRFSSNPVDKVAGINYLMWPKDSRFDLPIYEEKLDIEEGWLRCVSSMRRDLKVELLFLFPYPRGRQDWSWARGQNTSPVARFACGNCSWIPTWGQVQSLAETDVSDVWEGLPIRVLSGQVYPNPRNPFYVRTYMWNLAKVLGLLVFNNCSIEKQAERVYKVSLEEKKNVAGFYASYSSSLDWEWERLEYVMLCLSLEINLPWVVCRRHDATTGGMRELHNNIKKVTGYERVMLLEKVTTLRTDDRLKISMFFGSIEQPMQSRDFDAVYII